MTAGNVALRNKGYEKELCCRFYAEYLWSVGDTAAVIIVIYEVLSAKYSAKQTSTCFSIFWAT